jgi:hypothetical protein
VFMSVYPQLALRRSERSVKATIASARARSGPRPIATARNRCVPAVRLAAQSEARVLGCVELVSK